MIQYTYDLETDVYNMAMEKIAALTDNYEYTEKGAGRTFKDPLKRLYNQIQHNSVTLFGKGPNSEAMKRKIVQKLKADPLVAKQFIGRGIDLRTKHWEEVFKGEPRYNGNLKALLFNKHKKDILPEAIKDLTDYIHSGFNMNAGTSDLAVDLMNQEKYRPLYDGVSRIFDEGSRKLLANK